MWQVKLQTDVIRGQWLVESRCWVHYEIHYLLAQHNKKTYIHFYHFDDWEQAKQLLSRIQAYPNFSPENKPGIWVRIRDHTPLKGKSYSSRKRQLIKG